MISQTPVMKMETIPNRGLRGIFHTGFGVCHARVPLAEGIAPLIVQDVNPYLKQKMGTPVRQWFAIYVALQKKEAVLFDTA